MTQELRTKDPWCRDERTWALVRLLIEARDSLPAITEARRRLHNISPSLADRIDDALKPWEVPSDTPGAI